MNNSHKYFENHDCRYYPCHKGTDNINCLFCYCPLYNMTDCPGNPRFIEKPEGLKKVCTDCIYPHVAENYDEMIRLLKERSFFNGI